MRRQIVYEPDRDYYAILGIDARADDESIRQAYRRAVREVHPDLNPDRQDWATHELQRVNEAYDVLSDHTLRRDYDRVRWPHIPTQAARAGQRSSQDTFGKSTYDPNRPWWEQVSPATAHESRVGVDASSRSRTWRRRRAMQPSDPFWMVVSGWLKKRELTRLNTLWLGLVGLWRSPYAGILSVLGVVLAVDVALILFVLITPNSWGDVETWIMDQLDDSQPPTLQISPTAVSDRLDFACNDPAMQITAPRMGDIVGSTFSIYGTIQHAESWSYSLAIGFVGQVANSTTPPSKWAMIRQPPSSQSIPEPAITDGLLTEIPVALENLPTGFYAIRLYVYLRNGETLRPCDIVVRYQPARQIDNP